MKRAISLLPVLLLLTGDLARASGKWTASSDYYVVTLDLDRNGAYTAGTGTLHPVTAAQGGQSTVLAGGRNDSAVSSAVLRSYSSFTDYHMGVSWFVYVQDPGFACADINDVAPPQASLVLRDGRPSGLASRWEIHSGPDNLLVEEEVIAGGEDLTGSAVQVTLRITNLGLSEVRIGLRNFWDLGLGNIGGGGGPAIGPRPPEVPEEPIVTRETAFVRPDFRSYLISNEATPSNPPPFNSNVYLIEATVGGIPLDPAPTPPDRLVYSFAGDETTPPNPDHFGFHNTCFTEYMRQPPRTPFRSDSAVAYYWGPTESEAVPLAPGETGAFTQYIAAYLEFPLTCEAGGPYRAECAGADTPVALDGSRSSNVEGEGYRCLWEPLQGDLRFDDPDSCAPRALVAGLGRHDARLLVHKGIFAVACEAQIEVVDTTPPVVTRAVAVPATLWPPNHRMVSVRVEIEAADACEGMPSIRLVRVESSEAAEAGRGGDGNTMPDVAGAELGTSDFDVLLRAERAGSGIGRSYTLIYEVSDTSGNSVTVPVAIQAPHDSGEARR